MRFSATLLLKNGETQNYRIEQAIDILQINYIIEDIGVSSVRTMADFVKMGD